MIGGLLWLLGSLVLLSIEQSPQRVLSSIIALLVIASGVFSLMHVPRDAPALTALAQGTR